MKVILATDPIFWPLTGIGRYTFELAKKFSSEPRLADIRFFNMGRWQESTEFEQFGNESKLESSNPSIKGKSFEPYRHEWVSVRLFQAFVGDFNDEQWLKKLANISDDDEKQIIEKDLDY